jgi:hypothetical protein
MAKRISRILRVILKEPRRLKNLLSIFLGSSGNIVAEPSSCNETWTRRPTNVLKGLNMLAQCKKTEPLASVFATLGYSRENNIVRGNGTANSRCGTEDEISRGRMALTFS